MSAETFHDNFHLYDSYNGLVADDGEGTKVLGFSNARPWATTVRIPEGGAVFGYVAEGDVAIDFQGGRVDLRAGAFFTKPDGCRLILGGASRVVVFQRAGQHCFETIGLVEKSGRLAYIDGCYDTLLSAPPKKGDACLNALWVPTGIHQTMHTHPSTRAGYIVSGEGECHTRVATHKLRAGQIFFLPKNGWHKFRTDLAPTTIHLIAFHPDSDHGPSDDEHPMLNRTIVDGVSAADLADIRTKR